MKISKVEVEVPAGKYILGDPCYAVPDSEWMELLESCEFFNSPIGTIRRRGIAARLTITGISATAPAFATPVPIGGPVD